jgi:hypothetical protein
VGLLQQQQQQQQQQQRQQQLQGDPAERGGTSMVDTQIAVLRMLLDWPWTQSAAIGRFEQQAIQANNRCSMYVVTVQAPLASRAALGPAEHVYHCM